MAARHVRVGGLAVRLGHVLLLAVFLAPSLARATFSIVACDADGSCGAAVATNNLAVGSSVIYAQAGVGALATQFETNPHYGPKGLALMASGAKPQAVLDRLLAEDGDFEGDTIAARQVGLVDLAGDSASYTGKEASDSPWAGALTGKGYSIQGNGLAGPRVVGAMRDAFLTGKGSFADRLLAALEAGQAAGGQSTGKLSAALLVRTREGDWQDIDLRVDASLAPLSDLRKLLGMHEANDVLARAGRALRGGQPEQARAAIAEAQRLAPGWDRVWRRSARLDMQLGDRAAAEAALAEMEKVNPVWAATEKADPLYRPSVVK